MTERSDIAPETLRVALEPEGVEVEYLDGRSVFYHGVPRKREGSVVCPPGRDVHVLVTSPAETEGVMVYVNDRTTDDAILESTGVGRVVLERDEGTALFPGVEATNHGYRIEVAADPEHARGRVFVFAEDETGEAAYELVGEGEPEADDGAEAESDAEANAGGSTPAGDTPGGDR